MLNIIYFHISTLTALFETHFSYLLRICHKTLASKPQLSYSISGLVLFFTLPDTVTKLAFSWFISQNRENFAVFRRRYKNEHLRVSRNLFSVVLCPQFCLARSWLQRRSLSFGFGAETSQAFLMLQRHSGIRNHQVHLPGLTAFGIAAALPETVYAFSSSPISRTSPGRLFNYILSLSN